VKFHFPFRGGQPGQVHLPHLMQRQENTFLGSFPFNFMSSDLAMLLLGMLDHMENLCELPSVLVEQ
jgi:hypothetical protein